MSVLFRFTTFQTLCKCHLKQECGAYGGDGPGGEGTGGLQYLKKQQVPSIIRPAHPPAAHQESQIQSGSCTGAVAPRCTGALDPRCTGAAAEGREAEKGA